MKTSSRPEPGALTVLAVLACALVITPSAGADPRGGPQALPDTAFIGRTDIQTFVSATGETVELHHDVKTKVVKPRSPRLLYHEKDSPSGPAQGEVAVSGEVSQAKHMLLLKVASRAVSTGQAANAPTSPENSRLLDATASLEWRDTLSIRSTAPIAGAKVTFFFKVSGKVKTTQGGGGGVSGGFGMTLDGYSSGSASAQLGSHETSKNFTGGGAPNYFCTVTGDLSPDGFKPQGAPRFFETVVLSVSIRGSSSVTQYYENTYEVVGLDDSIFAQGELEGFTVSYSNGGSVPVAGLSVTAASGFNYGYFLERRPLDVAPAAFRGPVGNAANDASTALKGFFDAALNFAKGAAQTPRERGGTPAEPEFSFSGKLTIGAGTFAVKGNVLADGSVRFFPGDTPTKTLPLKGGANLVLTLALTDRETQPKLTGTVTHSTTSEVANVNADFVIYKDAKTAVASFPETPAAIAGAYTIALPPADVAEQTLTADKYPAGAGTGSLTVGAKGSVKFKGRLPDGTPLACSGSITMGGECYLYSPLYKNRGFFAGKLFFRDVPGVSDVDADDLLWTRPQGLSTTFYPDGWAAGVTLTALGSKYVRPPKTPAQSVFPGLDPADVDGNAGATLSGGGLGTPLVHDLNIATNNKTTIVDAGDDKLALSIASKTGVLSGSFVPTGGKKTAVQSVIVQKAKRASGYFLTPTKAGALEVVATH